MAMGALARRGVVPSSGARTAPCERNGRGDHNPPAGLPVRSRQRADCPAARGALGTGAGVSNVVKGAASGSQRWPREAEPAKNPAMMASPRGALCTVVKLATCGTRSPLALARSRTTARFVRANAVWIAARARSDQHEALYGVARGRCGALRSAQLGASASRAHTALATARDLGYGPGMGGASPLPTSRAVSQVNVLPLPAKASCSSAGTVQQLWADSLLRPRLCQSTWLGKGGFCFKCALLTTRLSRNARREAHDATRGQRARSARTLRHGRYASSSATADESSQLLHSRQSRALACCVRLGAE